MIKPIKMRIEAIRLLLIPLVIGAVAVVVNALELASSGPRLHYFGTESYYSESAEGTIESVESGPSSLVLRLNTGEGAVVDVTLDSAETVVLLEGRKASAQELARGQRVKVHYKVRDGKKVATSVVIQMPSARFAPATNDWKHPGLP